MKFFSVQFIVIKRCPSTNKVLVVNIILHSVICWCDISSQYLL